MPCISQCTIIITIITIIIIIIISNIVVNELAANCVCKESPCVDAIMRGKNITL